MSASTPDAEYSLQYFGFTPVEFLRDFTDVVLQEVTLLIKQILKEISLLPNVKDKHEKKCIEIHDSVCNRCLIVVNGLKPLIDDIFTVPKNVLLPVDENKQKEYTEEEIKTLESEVYELEDCYKKIRTTIEYTKAKISLFELLEPVYKKVDEGMPLLKEFGENVNKLKELYKMVSVHNEKKKKLEGHTKKDGMDKLAYMFRTD